MAGNDAPQFSRLPWYPADFRAATLGWPLVARAIYRELLDASWTMNGLPNDPHLLRGIVNATPSEWRKFWPIVASKFSRGDDGLLRNPRLEQHRAKALELYERRKAGADKTNAYRRGQVVPFSSRGDK